MDSQIFETIKRVNEYGKEYRYARELAKTLEYSDFSNFSKVVKKAELACKNSGQATNNHFSEFTEMVKIGSGATRGLKSRKLSRYACYLIIQNADPNKEIVALGQTYFALQTRQNEISQQFLEDQKRTQLRGEVTEHNKKLFSTARRAGVSDYATFYDSGYAGLYGLKKKEIIEKKKLNSEDNILDHMSSEELAANLFRATQAEAKIKREEIKGQEKASKAHFEVGEKIRQTIKELWGTMPEEIPAVEDIKYAKKRLQELEHHEETRPLDIEEKLAQKFAEEKKPDPHYLLPDNVALLEQVIEIIKNNPGDHTIYLGENSFKVSAEGGNYIHKVLKKSPQA